MTSYQPLTPILVESLDEFYSQKRHGKHVSDVVTCPRQKLFQENDPLPKTSKELNFFSSGRAVHSAHEGLFTRWPERFNEHEVWLSIDTYKILQVVDFLGSYLIHKYETLKMDLKFAKIFRQDDIKTIEDLIKENREEYKTYLSSHGIDMENDIVAHIDLYDKRNNQPYEMKSYRAKSIEKPKDFHIQQCKYYMALTDAEYGGVFYQLLMNFDKVTEVKTFYYPIWKIDYGVFCEFPIKMSKREREEQLEKLIDEHISLDNARKANDPSLARHVMFDENFSNWLCQKRDWRSKDIVDQCNWYEKCRQINFPNAGNSE